MCHFKGEMKKGLWAIFLLFLVSGAYADGLSQVLVRREIRRDISAPFRFLAHESVGSAIPQGEGDADRSDAAQEVKENTAFKERTLSGPSVRVSRSSAPRPLSALSTSSTALSVATSLNFEGITDVNSWAAPDTNGSVGDTQYVQWVNASFAVFDKSTGVIVLGPVAGTSLWNGFGGPCQNSNSGDAIAQFDKAAHRWVMSQHAAPSGGPYYQCVAVSTTADATGSYYRYAFQITSYYPDYPKLAVWPDAYYLTIDEEDPAHQFSNVDSMVCALDRNAMLNGAAAQTICFRTSSANLHLLPSDWDGTIAPPQGSPNYLLNLGTNALNLWKLHVDFANPSNSTFTGPSSVAVNAFVSACGGHVCVPQSGTSQTLDSLADRLMWRLAYRNFPDGHESLIVNHAIGPQSAIRWYEIWNPGGTPQVVEQGTINPDSNYRWMGSVGMDQVGDIAMGYSESSSGMNPAIYINGRAASDPLGTMEGELMVFAGSGSQIGSNRWGDYSSLSIDPSDDCTFWYTNEYLSSNGSFNWNTRVTSFKFAACTGNAPPVTLTPSILVFGSQPVGTTSSAQFLTLTNQQNVQLNISNINASGNFSQSNNCGLMLAPGANCQINVTFAPTAGGTRTGNVSVTDDAGNSPQIANLTGNGTTPLVALSSSHLYYGLVALGSTSPVQTVIVTNKGAAPLSMGTVSASGDYSESDTCAGQVIQTSLKCSLSIKFSPSITGMTAGVVTITDNAPGSPNLIALSGSGVLPFRMSPVSLSFGTVSVGSTSAPQTITFTNYQSSPVTFTYTASGSYTVSPSGNNPCGSSLSAGSHCTLQVTFSPSTNGTINGALSVMNSTAYNPQESNLFGTGSGGVAGPLSFSTNTLNFGSVVTGTTSTTKSVTVTNTSATSVNGIGVTASANFSVTGCGGTLAAGAQCKIIVTFSPSAAGPVTGAITFTDSAAVSPQSLNLSGTGILPVMFSPTSLNFGSQNVGTSGAAQTVTLTNKQSSALSIVSIAASGDYTAVSGGSYPCGSSVPGLGSCTFAVTFTPAVTGTVPGVVTVTHNASSNPQVVGLIGVGQ
jgi:Abnormal spindle-like microcephaly-assoc'd, ASPM-SPD-2-Hydin